MLSYSPFSAVTNPKFVLQVNKGLFYNLITILIVIQRKKIVNNYVPVLIPS